MSDYDDLLRKAYEGEVFGAAFFAALADGPHGTDHETELLALRDVEAQTAGRLQPLVDRAGITVEGDPVEQGAQLAAGLERESWENFLTGLRGALPQFLDGFLRLRELAPDDPVLADLVAHEQAIDRFAELELDGRTDEALAVLRAHLTTPSPA